MSNSALSGNIPGIVSSAAAGLFPSLTSSLDNPTATQLGLKQYLHGTTYNGGNAPTVTCAQSGWLTQRAVFVPYQTQDGTWRLRFNMVGAFTSASVTNVFLSINGITFLNVGNYYQPCAGFLAGTTTNLGMSANCQPNTSNIVISATGAGTYAGAYASGDVELASKPSWAY